MQSYFEHVPERYHEELRAAIEAVTETKYLLDQVKARFGTNEPERLRSLMGQVFDGIEVTPDAAAELAGLIAEHESRRAACRVLLERAARGGPLPPPEESA